MLLNIWAELLYGSATHRTARAAEGEFIAISVLLGADWSDKPQVEASNEKAADESAAFWKRLVEAAGIEPASASTLQTVLHT